MLAFMTLKRHLNQSHMKYHWLQYDIILTLKTYWGGYKNLLQREHRKLELTQVIWINLDLQEHSRRQTFMKISL